MSLSFVQKMRFWRKFDNRTKKTFVSQIKKFIYKEKTESFFCLRRGFANFFLRVLPTMNIFLQPRMVIIMLNSYVYNNYYLTSYRECDSKRRKFKGSFASYDFLAQTVQTVRGNNDTKGCQCHHLKPAQGGNQYFSPK